MERNMAWAQHRRGHSLGSVALRDKDEDLALFKDMGKRDKSPFLRNEDQLVDHASLFSKFGVLSHPQSAPPAERRGIGAELLNSDADKTDYDWLMTPPGTPLFPSLDAEAPALQHGSLINRSLAAIKTSRQASTAPRARSPAPSLTRGNPSPSRRPITPQKPQTPSKHPTSTSSSTRPATPTRSSTPSSHISPHQPRPSTPTRQPSRPVTPLGARPATPTRRSPTPATTSRPSTPTLRRSTSSPTGSRTGGSSHIRNPSPTRSTASSATSVTTTRPARGLSPAQGPSPARGLSPSPSARGRSPSPSLRAPYPVDASDDIPPNLRTSSDRPSSAQRRAIAYGASPGEGLLRRTPSPARSVTSSVTRVERVSCRGETSDSESSFDTGSQSGVSAYGGLVTPERRRMLVGHGTGVEYGKASSVKGKRSGSATSSPQMGASASKKSFESAAREYHRGQVAAFRPLMTNSSISTFYSSRASGLLRRPLTPSSTCSSSEHGATVAHDSDEDAGSVSQWKPATKTSSGAHSPLHLFNKSVREAGTLDASISIVDDNDELSSFFRTPEALQVECMSIPVVSHCKVQELESPEFVSELNWLNSRNAHELDREYLKDFDGAADPISKQDSKHDSPCLEKIRDKLRHLKRESNEDAESASRAQETNIGDHEVELLLHGASCEVCGHRKRNCQCTTTTTSSTSQAQEAPSSPPNVAQGSRTDPKAANAAYAKERDIWYIYRHSSEYEVPVAGFSETKMEIDPPQILAKEVHMRRSPSVSTSPPTVYIGKSESVSRNVLKGDVKTDNLSTRLTSEAGNVTLGAALDGTEEFDGGLAATDVERKGREFGATTVSSMPELPNRKQVPIEPERATNIQGKHSAIENAQVYSSCDSVSSEPPQKSSIHTPPFSSSLMNRANTDALGPEGSVKKLEQENRGGGGQAEWGDRAFDIEAQVSPVHSNRNLTEEQRPKFSLARSAQEEAREQGPALGCTTVPEAHCIEEHVSVVPQVKKIIWQEEDLQQLGTHTEAERVLSRADEKERTCREGDEVELGWENGKVEDAYFVAPGYPPDGSVEIQRQVAHTNDPKGVKPKTTPTDDSGSYCFEPLELVGQKYLLTGEVHIDSALYGAARLSDDSLVIKVQSSDDGRVLAVDNPARLISEPQNEKNSYAVYEYSHWAEVGARLTFSAHSGRGEENSSSGILFYPREQQVHVTSDEKQPRVPVFQGRPGVYAKEVVVPALDVARISAVSEKDGATEGLKSGEIVAVTCSDGANVAGPLYDDFTSAGIPSSRHAQRHPKPLLKAPDATAAQPRADVPAGKTDVQEVQRGNVTSHNGDLPHEVVNTYSAGASTEELTGERFDYILDSKRDPRRALPTLREVLMPSAEIPDSAMVKPSSFNGVNPSTNGSERFMKEKTPKRNQNQDSMLKFTSRGDAELPVLVSQSGDSAPKCTSGADAELPVGRVNQSRDTSTKYTSHGDSGIPVGVSQSRSTTPKSTATVDSVPKAKVSVEAPVKEEIVESVDSPSPGATRKHMSSFKFSHKKTGPSELKRSNTTFSSSTTKVGTQPATPGSKRTLNNSSSSDSNNSKAPVNRKPASSPQLNKGRSVRAPSPARPPANAKAAVTHVAALPAAAGGSGEVSPEEPSIHSRFSNITVRSGSDTEIFDWGPSSLEETSSRCGSSSGPNAASVAVLSRSPSSSLPLEDMANGHHDIDDEDEDDEDDEVQTTSPSPQSSVVNSRDDGIQSSPSSESSAGSSAMHPTERVRPHHDPTRTVHNNNYNSNNYNNNNNNNNNSIYNSNSNNNNYAPKQNLDKLSEKLEQLETFGARVLLRNPQQQFLRSPPSHGNHSNHSKPALVGHHPQSFPLVSCRSSRSLGSVRFGATKATSPVPDKCRCSIL